MPHTLPGQDCVEVVRPDPEIHNVELGLVRDVCASRVRRRVVRLWRRRRRRPRPGHGPVAPRRGAAAPPRGPAVLEVALVHGRGVVAGRRVGNVGREADAVTHFDWLRHHAAASGSDALETCMEYAAVPPAAHGRAPVSMADADVAAISACIIGSIGCVDAAACARCV